jgi:hypothetical protein
MQPPTRGYANPTRARSRNAARAPGKLAGPVGRSWLLWAFVLLVNLAGGVFLWLLMPPGGCGQDEPCGIAESVRSWLWGMVGRSPAHGDALRGLLSPDDFVVAILLAAIASMLVAAPFIGFPTRGWFARFAYLRRFWSVRLLGEIHRGRSAATRTFRSDSCR